MQGVFTQDLGSVRMAAQDYTRLVNVVEPEDVETPKGKTRTTHSIRRKYVLTGLTAVVLVWIGYNVTGVRTGSSPYNPLPNGGDDVYNSSSLPVVLWHGMGDSCCATWSIGALQKQIEDSLPGNAL